MSQGCNYLSHWGDAARLFQDMGPKAGVDQKLSKLEIQYGQVGNSDVLLQNCYQITKKKSEKVLVLTARSERALNQLRLQFPSLLSKSEVEK